MLKILFGERKNFFLGKKKKNLHSDSICLPLVGPARMCRHPPRLTWVVTSHRARNKPALINCWHLWGSYNKIRIFLMAVQNNSNLVGENGSHVTWVTCGLSSLRGNPWEGSYPTDKINHTWGASENHLSACRSWICNRGHRQTMCWQTMEKHRHQMGKQIFPQPWEWEITPMLREDVFQQLCSFSE